MGIYDRDYYRESARFRPWDGRVQAFVVLIFIYVAVYILQIATREDAGFRQAPQAGPVTEALTLNADKVFRGEVWRIITYAFVHDPLSPAPLIVNIIFLVFFGRLVEELYGGKEFLGFYLVANLLAGIGYILIAGIAQSGDQLVGPQGAITALLLLVALHNPKRTVLLFFVIPCPIWFVVAINVLLGVVGYFGGKVHPMVFAAHAFAAGFAVAYFRYHLSVTNWLSSRSVRSGTKKTRPKLQIYRDEGADADPNAMANPVSAGSTPVLPSGAVHAAASAAASATAVMDEQLEAKLDEVLDKVRKYGQESLSEEERSVLFRASEIYRKRRKTEGG